MLTLTFRSIRHPGGFWAFSSWARPFSTGFCCLASRIRPGCLREWWPLLWAIFVGWVFVSFYYLDDWLLVAESRVLLESHLRTTLQWTRDLGFLVYWEKSSLTPQRLPSYLGALLVIPRLLARPSEPQGVGSSGGVSGSC